MIAIREYQPERRQQTTRNPTGSNWSHHKPDLKEDFNSSCGYCGAYDGFRHTYYEVDHFVPKSLFTQNENIGLCDYHNLTYSCKFCNNTKSNKWPTEDENIPHDGSVGFVDACHADYETHLYREESGRINYRTDVGRWMVEVGFKFDERHLEIELLWNLNEVRKSIDALVALSEDYDEESATYEEIQSEAKSLALVYFLRHQELIDFYDA